MFLDNLKDLKPYKKIINDIEKKVSPLSIHGLSEESIAHIVSGINNHLNKQILLITHDELRAKKIIEDIKLFSRENVELYPARQLVFYDVDAYSHEITNQRIKVIDRLTKEETVIIVSSIEAIINKVINKNVYKKYTMNIEFGEDIDLDKMTNSFIIQGYERVDMIEGKGQFSIRGGIIDIFPVMSEHPFRIELFDNEIDSIRSFDITNQRSIKNLTKVNISPVKEVLIEEDDKDILINNIKNDLEKTVKKLNDNKEEEIARKLKDKFEFYIERIDENLNLENDTALIPYLPDKFTSVLKYLNDDAVVIIDEPKRISESIEEINKDFLIKYTDLFESGEVLNKQQDINFSYEDITHEMKEKMCITTSALLKNSPLFKPKAIINMVTKSMQGFHNKIDLLKKELDDLKYKGYKVIILSGTEDRGKRLVKSLMDRKIDASFVLDKDRDIKSSQVVVTSGTISKGFEYPNIKFAIISDKEIFGTYKKKRQRKARKDSKKINSFSDLKVGDYVVHENHGIGKYVGIEKLKVQDVKKDYLSVKYSGRDMLYIPVDQMDLIQKYIGKDTIKPKVNKLGSGEWNKTKRKVKKAIEDMAKDLLKLYAKRHSAKGYAFSKDQPWQKEFEDSFPYEETPDQIKCIDEIKRDMEKPRPMDRLLCGDVGYGKTEVALRAAFKAVMDGKQVAILVPTTILAQQHFNTIMDRFSEFPIKGEMLSRFRTPGQQKRIIGNLRSGNLDIVVGTHRLLSKDVKFKNLGLLIVDEEQRFGVKHKETLKELKESIDVLTLTATPIPRTLHMSLLGVRDMSVIEQPPEERYPIQTYVLEYNEQLVRDALVKELKRNGQIYFVFNRVRGIKKMASKLKKLIPEAKIAVGHGQMSERELEKVMIDFLNKEYDCLVCTTIIETGLDIPNVNTMIIYDSDKMGLSQLYQLRGRVGRSNRIAFSYFMYEKDKVLKEVAEKRLKAIKEFTEFGSGFKIAMRDLEIRGAGNLLGAEQHGHMASIGYDLYVKYLEETVKKLKGDKEEIEVDTTIELNVDGFIPKSYISNEELKVEMYKKISTIENDEEYSDVVEELIDRFGDIPKEVNNLLRISKVKSICKKHKIISLTQNDKFISIQLEDAIGITPELIDELNRRYRRRMTFDLSNKPILKYKLNKSTQNGILSEVEDVVKKISYFNKK
ncbi:MAG: transcription-repair coupling factor [Firmicutes bacterium]|nr:transcription-repair coupling factor [Bacillota bacterium]